MMGDKIRLTLEGLRISIPDLNDVMTRFGTNREAINGVSAIFSNIFDHRCNSVAHKGGASLTLENAETVGPAIDIVVILPERRDIVAHQEEHSVAQGVRF